MFQPIKSISFLLNKYFLDEFLNNNSFSDFIKFLFYLDQKFFREILTFFILSFYEDEHFIKSHLYHENILIAEEIFKIYQNKTLLKEIKIFRQILGF